MDLTEKQQKIIDTNDKTLLVSASAGSGKTFVVVQKIIDSIIKKKTSIDSLLVVTFTNAAASELKQRIMQGLREKLEKETDRCMREYLSSEINKVWSASISTIHSFCLSVIKDNFMYLGIDPNVSTIDPTKASIMLHEAIENVLEVEAKKQDNAFIDMLTLLGSEDSFIDITTKIYFDYVNVLDKDKFKSSVFSLYGNSEKIEDLTELEFGEIVLNDAKLRLSVVIAEINKVICDIEHLSEFEKHRAILLTQKNYLEHVYNSAKYNEMYDRLNADIVLPSLPASKGADEIIKEKIKTVKKLGTELVNELKKTFYGDTAGILNDLNSMFYLVKWFIAYMESVDDEFTKLKSQRSAIDFSDYERLALKALNDKAIKEKYESQYSQIYIDEYQDTSFAQEAILTSVARFNNCIMVGDVKQSIYAFRNARPELFSKKYDEFKDDEGDNIKISLTQNFRSRKQVIDSINFIFEKTMSLSYGGARYSKSEALEYAADYEDFQEQDYKTEIHILKKNDDNLDEELESIELESKAISKRIKELVGKYQIYDLKKGEFRPCKYKDVVILSKVITSVSSKIEQRLRDEGIPVSSNSRISFYETEEISLILSFLKVLDNVYDDIALASVMYSIIGGFTLDEIATIRLHAKNTYLYNSLTKALENEENEDLIKKIQHLFDIVEKYREYVKVYGIARTIIKLYNDTGVYNVIKLEYDSKKKILNLDALVQVAKEYESAEYASLYSFISYIENIKKREKMSDGPKLVGENEDAVRIMSIHHSKGLEFPIVILIDTARKYTFPDLKEKILIDESLGLGIEIYNKEYGITFPSIIKTSIKQSLVSRQKSEALRLLYVALTRAKEKLIIYGLVDSFDKLKEKNTFSNVEATLPVSVMENSNSFLNIIMSTIFSYNNSDMFEVIVEDVANEAIEEVTCQESESKTEKLSLKEKELVFDWKYPYEKATYELQKYTATELSHEQFKEDISDVKPRCVENKLTATGFGTLVHQVMNRLNLKDASKDNIKDILLSLVTNTKEVNIDKISSDILFMINSCLNPFIKNSKNTLREYEFVVVDTMPGLANEKIEEPTYIQGAIDLCFELHDKYVIVDYKTDNATEEEIIDRYKKQLYIYKRAIEISKNAKIVETYIYSFKLKKLICITFD